MGEGGGDVGGAGRGVGEDRGDDDGPQQRSSTTGSKGERAPFFLFYLDLPPRWEKGFPSEIGSISLFLRSLILPLHRFFYIRRSVTPIGVNLSPRSF